MTRLLACRHPVLGCSIGSPPGLLPGCAGAGIGQQGARELVQACRQAGLKTAVASSADRVKVRRCSVSQHASRGRISYCCACSASWNTHFPTPHSSQVDANLAAADISQDLFDTIVSADAFERLKPSPGARTCSRHSTGIVKPSSNAEG